MVSCVYSIAASLSLTRLPVFRDNVVGDDGGAIAMYDGSTSVIRSCNFIKNSAKDKGGAVIGINGSTVRITNSSFNKCRAGYVGRVSDRSSDDSNSRTR